MKQTVNNQIIMKNIETYRGEKLLYLSHLLSFLLFFFVFTASGQENLKKITKTNKEAGIKEIYTVLKSNPDIKQGTYSYLYGKNIQITGQYENNMKEGTWVYTPSNDYKIIGNYHLNNKTGSWYYKIKNDTVSILNYVNDTLDKKQCGFYPTGGLASELYFLHGKRDSIQKHYYKNGSILEEIEYKNDLLDGNYKYYSEDGQLACCLVYKNGQPFSLEDISDTPLSTYSGSLKYGNGKLINLSKNVKTGKMRKEMERTFKNGLLEGEFISYNDNETVSCKGYFMEGYLVKKWMFYDQEGKFNHEKSYSITQKLKNDTSETDTKINDIGFKIKSISPCVLLGDTSVTNILNFIASNNHYPIECRNKGIKGIVVTEFTMNTLGKVQDVEVLTSPHNLMSQEAKRVIGLIPNCFPFFDFFIPENLNFIIPVSYIMR